MDDDLTRLTAREAARQIAAGKVSSEALTRACLDRIAMRDDVVHAFVHFEPEFALAEARRVDREAPRSPLHGVPFAVKDVIDTADFPTERGTPIHRGRRPQADATCVARLRAAGAVLLGKVVTTEYAMFTPNATRHPLNPAHTPGGSSSGTAAAVADAMVPFALGNQTAGSLIRPAAFCGVYGLKPTHGTTDGAGILPLQPCFDTLGYMARDARDLALAYGIVRGAEIDCERPAGRRPRIGLCQTWQWEFAEPACRAMFSAAARRFSERGVEMRPFVLPDAYADLVAVHRRVLYAGIAKSLADDYAHAAARMSEGLRSVIEEGLAVSAADYAAGCNRVARCRDEINRCLQDFDALLCPSAPGEAPAGMATGNPVFQVTWTLLGVPCINLPVGRGPAGLPLGLQLVGRRHDDAHLIALASQLMDDFEPITVSARDCA